MSLTYDEFKAAVLERQIRNHQRKGRVFCETVPEAELTIIEGDKRMRTEAAEKCKLLLKAAREALAAAKSAGDGAAMQTKNIGVHSAYRTIAEDTLSWNETFLKYYNEAKSKHEVMPGGIHGQKALAAMYAMMKDYKAAPGYSNHSNGLAVDFKTMQGKTLLKSQRAQRALWVDAWLYKWLVDNAIHYRFFPLSTEEWHWDYK